MTKIIDFALSKAKTTLMIAFMIIIAGSYARQEISIAASPNVQLPFISVSVYLDGASPNDTSRLIAKPLENRLMTITGVKNISSRSVLSFARIFLEFEVGYDMDKALVDIKQAVEETKYELPREAEDPQISEYSEASFPVMNISIVGKSSIRQKVFYAKDLKDKIEGIEEILEANLSGAPEEVLEGVINKSRMESYGVTLSDIYYSVANNNLIIPGGTQDTGKGSFNIEVPSVIESAQDVYSIPIKVTEDAIVTLGDIADIKRTFKDFTSYARVNGLDAVTLEVRLREGANAIDASNEIRNILEGYRNTLPENLKILISDDDTIYAVEMVKELNGNIITAVVLIMVLVIASMGFRVSMLVGLSIPFCFLFTYLTFYSLGMEINFLVMMGLLLGMGMLIDGAIVITEYADKKISEGLSRAEGYKMSSKRMFYPILASTGTTMAAFIPVMLWPGFTGQFMRYLPITVFTVLIGSLIYSLVLIPVLGTYLGQTESTLNKKETRESIFKKLTEFYGKRISKFVKNPIETCLAVLSLLLLIIMSYSYFGKGTIYFALVDPVQAEIQIKARGNYSALETKEIVELVEERFLAVEGLSSVYLRAGTEWWNSGADKIGGGFIEVAPAADRTRSGLEIMELLNKSVKDLPGIFVEITADIGGPSFDTPIELDILGNSEFAVNRAVDEVESYLRNVVTGLINITSTKPYPSVEWSVEVDKQKAAQLGVSVADVGALVQMLTNGFKVGEYRPDDSRDEVEIRARFPESDRTITGIQNLNVTTLKGLVPVSSFISVIPKENRQTINRRNGKFSHAIGAATLDESQVSAKVQEIDQWLQKKDLGQGVTYKFSGMAEETEEVNNFMIAAGIMAVFIMLVMLLTQFNSFYQSFIILTSVTISFVGVLLGLLITGKPFSTTMTGLSIVTLAGIVVNNNIVLIDTFNKLRFESPHIEKSEHIINACKQRLRPILLTSLTTIFGLLPLAMGLSVDIVARDILVGSRIVDWWSNLAVSIVFGLGFSTFITLILTPAVLALPYALRNDFKKFFKITD
ncbi:efflux RND transporter permease subunit [Gammaproteobacteria bacterium]|nr:efflux RND transporter permease subunit [Gammaproteobacteria bacterium]MDA7735216.1 efflux RND transporter permease subunit [Gammaproteobacteria bacterium]MDA9147227.1 efflux RND transporter permease subunit [Gammaproteobacteria bacterium]MDB2662053.1 efflux RND transporter permease subunit [Gammaproteobacteria bacterium]MDB9974049.1 efflux RND transporter permease subunit [Gammaproteobacteria bacterium]